MQPHQRTTPIQPRTPSLMPATPVRVEAVAPDAPAEILTPRLRLRPLTETDRPAFCELHDRNREHLEAFLPLGAPDQPSDSIFSRQLELTTLGDTTGKAFRRIAVDLETGELVGAFNLVVIRRGLEWDADIGCWLAAAHTGRGLAGEGLAAMLSYSFADLPEGLGLHAIVGFIVPENTASQRLAARFGFERQTGGATHMTTGDRWQLHEQWKLTIARWQAIAS